MRYYGNLTFYNHLERSVVDYTVVDFELSIEYVLDFEEIEFTKLSYHVSTSLLKMWWIKNSETLEMHVILFIFIHTITKKFGNQSCLIFKMD